MLVHWVSVQAGILSSSCCDSSLLSCQDTRERTEGRGGCKHICFRLKHSSSSLTLLCSLDSMSILCSPACLTLVKSSHSAWVFPFQWPGHMSPPFFDCHMYCICSFSPSNAISCTFFKVSYYILLYSSWLMLKDLLTIIPQPVMFPNTAYSYLSLPVPSILNIHSVLPLQYFCLWFSLCCDCFILFWLLRDVVFKTMCWCCTEDLLTVRQWCKVN